MLKIILHFKRAKLLNTKPKMRSKFFIIMVKSQEEKVQTKDSNIDRKVLLHIFYDVIIPNSKSLPHIGDLNSYMPPSTVSLHLGMGHKSP